MRFLLLPLVAFSAAGLVSVFAQSNTQTALEDFKQKDEHGFPVGWRAQRSETKAKEAYRINSGNGMAFLTAKAADQRVYKKIAWDPKATPIVTWRWRLKSVPTGADPIAAVFLSLDTDLMVIPVATKYLWSATKPVGTLTEGGVFDASEIVLRSGAQPVGEWVEERVNAYEDFKRIHKHEPADKAWGISLLGGPGVEVDFGPITASTP
ncbi:MAG TPA: DUF3047 domain-containing protein [Nitrospiraceae bacterium]|nr:DUF3047 domain-containing protein [Nitrospiraceae bacterium]